jgi:Zn-dependent peptidase ImmA (M78 family)/transcriptional regulator with XRE-family HTH domain
MQHANPAFIEPVVLSWALRRANTTRADLASSAGTSEAIVDAWLEGSRKPTFPQARKIATKLKVPFGFLFLSDPPPETLPIPDLRTLAGAGVREPSIDLRDVVLATMRKQEWLSDQLRRSQAEVVEVVGMGRGATSDEVAAQIRERLRLDGGGPRPARSDEYLRILVEKAEGIGVNVLRNGVVGNNTHRPLSVAEFRGFCISDPYAPFIFINGADAPNGQIFTLVHELAHIWRADTGVSGGPEGQQSDVEAFCNRVAAEVLVPASAFNAFWNSSLPLDEAIDVASSHFRISRYVVALRAFESGIITRDQIDDLIGEYQAAGRGGTSSGGDFYRTLVARNGRSFTTGVVEAVGRQSVLVREAAGLLDAKPGQLPRLAQMLQQSG